MDETEPAGMEHQASGGICLRPVFRVSGYRMADGLHLRTDLVLASRLQIEFHERIAIVRLQESVACDRFLPVTILCHVHLHMLVLHEVGYDQIRVFLRSSLYHGHVGPLRDSLAPVGL